ncbi:peptide/nickel transport system substrate-binding protein [Pseudosulfitobacter pseudonitzschiae]|uniref:ABC transporter substrate-binding protein n=1 Tax=Pseudosulfitobacter pseudonitzschiae TaxID=1402135 RepID=A0A073JA96_9RHOB|nr:ABC transporter substrate-binding protein [Pseudosulfitobacter pseudonitzschiae]KEJ94642.1 ABC transporter substrate-binding protein [Pseudosulfitobacter pseudonitzschiae]QKS10776.1 ABC transporter substrate-binding protein [Pseudosulfitobacter pseudonitzschiae]SHG16174.1 peptide/nickel transport system substrate-binding protein [Pseudosulfitobacter pseudonitzschiae]
MKHLKLVSALAISTAVVLATGQGAVAQENVLKWASQADIANLDPHGTTGALPLSILGNVYEPLVMRASDMSLAPGLATSWEVIEPTVWRFHLREGVKFQNGNDFNADDVIFSMGRVGNEYSFLRDRVTMVTEMTKVDDYTIDFHTAEPNPILPNMWTSIYMMDKEWAEENSATVPSNTVENIESYAGLHSNGTGPFRVTERQPETKTVFEPFDGWWGERTDNLDRVIYTPITQDGTRVAALLSGEIDMMFPVPLQDIDRVNANAGTRVLIQPELRTIMLGMDQNRDVALLTDTPTNPFKDRRVRLALYQAIDIDGIQSKLMNGLSEPAATLISPLLFAPAGEMKRYPFDPEASRKLLAEAGYPDGFRTALVCPNNRYVNDEKICQAVASMLARVGIQVDLRTMNVSQYWKVVGRPVQEFAIYMMGWTPGGLDSYSVLFNLMGSWDEASGRGRINNGDFSNPRIDEIVALVESETDTAKRDALIAEAYQIVHDEVYYLPLHQQAVVWGVRDGVEVKQRADDGFNYADAKITR